MSIGSFAYVDTTSPNKLAVIGQQIELINEKFPQRFSGYCLGLPGNGAQCDRHVKEYSDYGIQIRKQIFVDRDYMVHVSHDHWKKQTRRRVALIHSDIQSAFDLCRRQQKQIDLIDYDGTSFFNNSHEDILIDAAHHDVKVVIIVMTTRAPHLTMYHEDWKQRLGLERRYLCPSKGWREPMRDIATGALESIAKEYGFDYTFFPYAGRDVGPPMVSCVFINKKFI